MRHPELNFYLEFKKGRAAWPTRESTMFDDELIPLKLGITRLFHGGDPVSPPPRNYS